MAPRPLPKRRFPPEGHMLPKHQYLLCSMDIEHLGSAAFCRLKPSENPAQAPHATSSRKKHKKCKKWAPKAAHRDPTGPQEDTEISEKNPCRPQRSPWGAPGAQKGAQDGSKAPKMEPRGGPKYQISVQKGATRGGSFPPFSEPTPRSKKAIIPSPMRCFWGPQGRRTGGDIRGSQIGPTFHR